MLAELFLDSDTFFFAIERSFSRIDRSFLNRIASLSNTTRERYRGIENVRSEKCHQNLCQNRMIRSQPNGFMCMSQDRNKSHGESEMKTKTIAKP